MKNHEAHKEIIVTLVVLCALCVTQKKVVLQKQDDGHCGWLSKIEFTGKVPHDIQIS